MGLNGAFHVYQVVLHFDGMVVVLPQVKASFMEKILDKEERGAGLSARAPLSHQPKLTS